MNSNWKKSIEERIEQFKLFYARKNDRPLLGFFLGSEYPVHRYPAAKSIPERTILSPDHFSIEAYLNDYDYLFEEHERCGGDFIWSASIYWGIPWVEAALGCPILLSSYSSGSIHAEPLPEFRGAADIPEFSLENKWVKKAIEFLEQMTKQSNRRYPLATTRMRGISDLLSLLYGTENLIFAMLEKPDEINAVAEKLTDFWIQFGKMQIEHIPDFYGGIGSFYYNAWAPKGTIWHQEDAAAILSPDLYNAFIRKWDEQIVNAFGGCIMHQHSNGYFPYEYYINMDFTALELHIDSGGPSAESLQSVYAQIMKNKPLIIWGDIPENDLEWIFSNLLPQGLAVITVVKDENEAGRIWEKYINKVIK
ncbi:hypothetical protein GM418_30425 [Maribellus comscasis]|uniref:Uncharacterized protein n=1 Tax=Maribellus comscasis TaxID=2681766 RepID=A0A6I6K541_9BACT|nr:uroporphyrinogen decarboxylase family protein [Maribellus comscasis]QGY47817.1 hypothetical protein GM418_30425 [Maribellus comscasis]